MVRYGKSACDIHGFMSENAFYVGTNSRLAKYDWKPRPNQVQDFPVIAGIEEL